MEDQFDIQIDFENMSNLSIPNIFETQSPDDIISLSDDKGKGKKIYSCPVPDCGKAFRYKSELKRHNVIHNGDRPYCCIIKGCDKAFKRPDALKNHVWLHSNFNNLPFICEKPGCDRRFASKAALKYHEIKHGNKRVFNCEFESCDKAFLQASQLRKHQKICKFQSTNITSEGAEEFSQRPEDFLLESTSESHDSVQLEIKIQRCNALKLDEDPEKNVQILLNYLLNENRMLKEKIYRQDFVSSH